ncbi:MAG: polC1 [Microbacterium sp.]|nr:polC1 [Microbacterium sp.]
MTLPVLAFDTETNGIDTDTARIVTAYLGILSPDGVIVREQEWMVRPDGWTIPEEAAAIHGVSTEEALANGRPAVEVISEIAAIIAAECGQGHLPLVGQNLQYDLTLLDRELRRHGLGTIEALLQGVVVLDSLVLDKEIDRYRRGKRILTSMAEHYGVTLTEDEAHGARADAVAAGRIIQAMTRHPKGAVLRKVPLPVIHQKQIAWKAEQAASLQQYFRTKGGEPDAVVRGEWPFIPAAA